VKVGVQGNRDNYRGEVARRYEFWLPPFGGCHGEGSSSTAP
jgi:hypothetical protein